MGFRIEVEQKVGGSVRILPPKVPERYGDHAGKVLACEPPRRLAHTFAPKDEWCRLGGHQYRPFMEPSESTSTCGWATSSTRSSVRATAPCCKRTRLSRARIHTAATAGPSASQLLCQMLGDLTDPTCYIHGRRW